MKCAVCGFDERGKFLGTNISNNEEVWTLHAKPKSFDRIYMEQEYTLVSRLWLWLCHPDGNLKKVYAFACPECKTMRLK